MINDWYLCFMAYVVDLSIVLTHSDHVVLPRDILRCNSLRSRLQSSSNPTQRQKSPSGCAFSISKLFPLELLVDSD